jgi:hypothetical protein
MKCRDCGKFRFAKRHEMTRAARVRCLYCGGPMEVSHDGQKKMAYSQDVVNEHKDRTQRAQRDPRFWLGQTPQEGTVTTQDKLQAAHGTPEEFEKATWAAFYDKMIDASEAMEAITRYRKEWVAAGDRSLQENRTDEPAPDVICASILEENGKFAVLIHVDGGRHISQTSFKFPTLEAARAVSDKILDQGLLLARIIGLNIKRFNG